MVATQCSRRLVGTRPRRSVNEILSRVLYVKGSSLFYRSQDTAAKIYMKTAAAAAAVKGSV